MSDPERNPSDDNKGYSIAEDLTQQFVKALQEIDKSIHDFEFDCHQVSQLIFSPNESLATKKQLWAYLLEYEKEIVLLAPFSYFVNCALKILPKAQVSEFAPGKFTYVYNYYNERGRKARLSLEDLVKKLEKFHNDRINFMNHIMDDSLFIRGLVRVEIYYLRYKNCLLFVNDFRRGSDHALAVFFKYRDLIRRNLIAGRKDIIALQGSEGISED